MLVKQVWAVTTLLTPSSYSAVATWARPAALTAAAAPTAKTHTCAYVNAGGVAAGLPSPASRDAGRAG